MVYNSLERVLNIFSDWSFMIGEYNNTLPPYAISDLNLTIGLKECDKIFVLMNFELNQMVGLWERDQSKFLDVLVQWHMSLMF